MVTHGRSEISTTIAFAGGGTGGHLYPALAVLAAIKKRRRVRGLFFATDRNIDQLILPGAAADCDYVSQRLKPLRSGPWHWPGIAKAFWSTSRTCKQRLEEGDISIVIGTGGLASVPAVRQAQQLGIPTALLNPDAVPGKANRFLAPQVDLVFTQWEETEEYLSEHTNVATLGCPIRSAFAGATRERGIEVFGLDPKKRTLLVTGASQGARTLNDAMAVAGVVLRKREDWQVVHLTGQADAERMASAYGELADRAKVMAYTDEMPAAIAAADLVVSRAGASTLAELTAVGRASILLPYPHHRDMHQLANARCLVRRGAARIVKDRMEPRETGEELASVLDRLMGHDEERVAIALAAQRSGKPGAADQIAERVLSIVDEARVEQGCEYMEPSIASGR